MESEGTVLSFRRQFVSDTFMWTLLVLVITAAIFLRQQTLFASREFVDESAGIRLDYPANWLLEESENTIFRVVDVANPRYETTMQIRIIPVRILPPVSGYTVLYSLSVDYAGMLANFRTLDFPLLSFGAYEDVRGMSYTFVSSGSNPLIQQDVVVVRGLDLVLIQRGQAFVISYRAAAEEYETQLPFFQRFAESLEL